MTKFNKLGLSEAFIANLNEYNIKNPTDIQEKALPLAMIGKDIIGGSATGSGKTLIFSAPIIENIRPNNQVQALILTPTRELAEQISSSIKQFSRYKKLSVLAVYGGVNIEDQIKNIYKTDVIVGTPGRILDHINRRTLSLRNIKYLVLDEVDRMFDMGFHKDVEKIIRECPKNRQTMLFSATISEEVFYLAKKYTRNPIRISVNSHVDPSKLRQIYYNAEHRDKFSLLVHLLKKEKADLVLVFCATRKNVDFVTDNLIKQGLRAKSIHGGIDQKKRTKTLDQFHNKEFNVLVCTDVAARGLDIKGVSHVYNYDLPKTSEEYLHRIGRTARAGEDGEAISLVCNRDYENFNNIELDKKLKISLKETPSFQNIWVNINALKGNNRKSSSRQRDPKRKYSQSVFSGSRPYSRRFSTGNSEAPKRSFGKRTFDRDSPRGSFRKKPSGGGSRRNFRANSKGRNIRKGRR